MRWQDRISSTPEVCHRKACITGTRIMATVILDSLAEGMEVEEIIEHYLSVSREAKKALEREGDFRMDLRGANLSEAQILDADLSRAMFHNSNLSNVNLANTELTDAFFSYGDPDNPLNLLNVLDAEPGEQLVWRGKPQCHQA